MYTVRERIEEIERSAVRQAEGLLLNAIRESWSNTDIVAAARFWDRAKDRLEDAQTWREKVKGLPGTFDFENMDRGHDDDDSFRLDSAGRVKNKRV